LPNPILLKNSLRRWERQRRFNEFDGEEVITDLSKHPSLWASFLFTKPIFAPDENGLSFGGVIDTLLAMALLSSYA
jgi:hypothetical protein